MFRNLAALFLILGSCVFLTLAGCSGEGDSGREMCIYVAEFELPHAYSRVHIYSLPQLDYLGKVGTNGLGARLIPAPSREEIWVSGEASFDLAVLSTLDDSMLVRVPVGRPLGVGAFDRAGERLLVCNSAVISRHGSLSEISLLDVASREVLGHIAVGENPRAVCFGPGDSLAYTANTGDDTISVIDLQRGESVRSVPTGPSPNHLSLDPMGRWLYVACMGQRGEAGRGPGELVIHSLPGLETIARVEAGSHPSRAMPTCDGKLLVVSALQSRDGDDCRLRLFRVAEEEAVAGDASPRPRLDCWRELDAGQDPVSGDISPDGRWFVVPDFSGKMLTLVDLQKGEVAKQIGLVGRKRSSFSVDAVFAWHEPAR